MVLGQRRSSTQTQPTGGAPPSTPAGPPPYNWRATLWLIIGILVVVGAMGVFMRVIPTPFTQPAPTAALTPRPTAQAAVSAPVTTPAPTPRLLDVPTAVPTAAPQAQPATVAPAIQATPAHTSAPTVQPTTAAVTAPTSQVTRVPTVDPALAAEILSAYQRYWHVLDDALASLDGSKLNGVMDGPELVAAEAYLGQLRSQNKAAVGPADHEITLVSATPEEAVIYDKVVDHSVFVDPTTKEPLPPEQQGAQPDTPVPSYYYLHKVDGVWKVVGQGRG